MSEVKPVLGDIHISSAGLTVIMFKDKASGIWWDEVIKPGTIIDDDLIEDLRLQAEIAINKTIAVKECVSVERKLREALKKYGRHEPYCDLLPAQALLGHDFCCSCGFHATRTL